MGNDRSLSNAQSALTCAHSRFEIYRATGSLDREGVAVTEKRRPFREAPKRKSRKQLEREITGDTTDAMGVLKWRPAKQAGASEAIIQRTTFSEPCTRALRLSSETGATSFSFRTESVSKTSKRHSAGEKWHSADHAKYLERDNAVAQRETDASPAAAADYIEREAAIAQSEDNDLGLFSNISLDPVKREEFWRTVQIAETEGGDNGLEVDLAQAGPLVKNVVDDPDCPKEFKDQIQHSSSLGVVTFMGGDHEALRKLFERHGWQRPPRGIRRSKSPIPTAPTARVDGVTFRDSRAGVTQIQMNGELPDELSIAGKFAVVEKLHNHFAARDLPNTFVVHKPDYRNDEKNWHFHGAIYDRPSKIFDNTPSCLHDLTAKSTSAEKKRHKNANDLIGDPGLDKYIGQWDFGVVWMKPKKSRNKVPTTPFRQNKDRYCNDEHFPEIIRQLLAELCNEQLALEGCQRRYDPRTFDNMGISKKADEHLDKRAAQLEMFGIPTAKGIANEERQWLYTLDQLDREHAKQMDMIGAAHGRLVEDSEIKAEVETTSRAQVGEWYKAAMASEESRRAIAQLEAILLRAESRAKSVSKVCRKHLAAIDADKAPQREAKSREHYARRLREAEAHLDGVKVFFRQQIQDLARLKCDRETHSIRAQRCLDELLHVQLLGPARFDVSRAHDLSSNNLCNANPSVKPNEMVKDVMHVLPSQGTPQVVDPSGSRSFLPLCTRFALAENDLERRTIAVDIRKDKETLMAMDEAASPAWTKEQRRFATLQRAGGRLHGGFGQ